jgi:hypothetical protein
MGLLGHFVDFFEQPFWPMLGNSLIIFPLGGIFWGYGVWWWLRKTLPKLEAVQGSSPSEGQQGG